LLHPGANTSTIISQYINTINALRIVDPTGVAIDQVGQPIRYYLW
jgi:anaphase-promoting complex subunit 2